MNHTLSEFGVSFHKGTLDNGVDVFLFQKKGSPINIRTTFISGAYFDTISGAAHFLEHMLVAGTKKYPSKDLLMTPLERIGGSFNASTGKDYLRLEVCIPMKEDLNIGLEIVGEMLMESLLKEEVLENERGSIISEIERSDSEYNRVLWRILCDCMFGNSNLSNHVAGTIESVKTISKSNLIDFKNKFIHAGRANIFVSGDISMEECLPLLNKHLGALKPGEKFKIPPAPPIYREAPVQVMPFHNNKTIYILAGFRGPDMDGEEELMSLELISKVLGQGRTSRMQKELRYKNGLTYKSDSYIQAFLSASLISATTSFSPDKFDRGFNILIRELKKMGESGLTQEELEFAKSSKVKSLFGTMQTSTSWIKMHEDFMILGSEPYKTIDYYMNKINSLKLEDVNAMAKKYLTKDNLYIALCGTDKIPEVDW